MKDRKILSRKRQFEYFEKRCAGVQVALDLFFQKTDPEQIHNLRVEVKKIRSLLIFQGDLNGKIKSIYKLLRKIFKQTGEIRMVHLHLELIKKYNLRSVILKKELEGIAAEKTKLFRTEIPVLVKKIKSGTEDLKRKFQDTKIAKLKRIVDAETAIAENAFNPFSVKELHESRKHIKNLIYFNDISDHSQKKDSGMNIEYLDRIQNLIGKWHDIVLTQNLIREKGIRNQIASDKLRKDLSVILKKLRKEVKDFRKKISAEQVPA